MLNKKTKQGFCEAKNKKCTYMKGEHASEEREIAQASSNDATPSMFGWQFQVSAAIAMMLEDLENNVRIKVEGKTEDIEITKNDGGKIYAQSKAMVRPFAPNIDNASEYNSNSRHHLKKAITSLAKAYNKLSAVDKEHVLGMEYVSNIQYPFGTSSNKPWRDKARYKHNELSEVEKSLYPEKIDGMSEQFLSLLSFSVIRYEDVEDWKTQQYEILSLVREFLSKLQIDSSHASEYLTCMQSICNFNAGTRKWDLSKGDFIWPAIVKKMEFSPSYFDEYEGDCILDEDDIRTSYKEVIDEFTYKLPMCLKIIHEYSQYRADTNIEKERRRLFAKHYGKILADSELEAIPEDARIIVGEYIVWNTIKSRNVFKNAHDKFLK